MVESSSDVKTAVIMSVYRSDDPGYLREAITSIVSQSEPCHLYLYRDGVVGAELQNVLDSFSARGAINYFFCDTNMGLAISLNKLIDILMQKDYEFVARMDSDDVSAPERLKKQVRYMRKNPNVDVCGTFAREFGASYALSVKSLPTEHDKLVDFSISRCPFIHPTVMFRSDVFRSGYRYPVNTTLTEDMALWFELLDAGFRFANLDEVLLDYRLSESTVGRRRGIKKGWSEFVIRLRYLVKLRRFSLVNILKVFSRLVFHLLPVRLLHSAYRFLR